MRHGKSALVTSSTYLPTSCTPFAPSLLTPSSAASASRSPKAALDRSTTRSTEVPRTLFLAPMRVEEWMLRRGIPRDAIVRIGMGRARSLAAAQSVRNRDFDRLVIAGVCGSLDKDFRPGDVLLPTQVSAPDVGTTQCTVDDALADGLRAAGLNVRTGTLVSHEK